MLLMVSGFEANYIYFELPSGSCIGGKRYSKVVLKRIFNGGSAVIFVNMGALFRTFTSKYRKDEYGFQSYISTLNLCKATSEKYIGFI